MSLDALLARVAGLEARVAILEARPTTGGGAASASTGGGGAAADDYDLDSEWGNPTIKKDPTRWKGESYAGCTYSQCPSNYLLVLASQHDWAASQDEAKDAKYKNKKGEMVATAPFKRKDAARARGWAARNQVGVARPAASPPAAEHDGFDEDIPF